MWAQGTNNNFYLSATLKGNRFSAVCLGENRVSAILLSPASVWISRGACNQKHSTKFLIYKRRPQRDPRAPSPFHRHTMHSQVGRRGVYLMEYYVEANNNLREQTRCKQTCMKSHPRARPREEAEIRQWDVCTRRNENQRKITPTSKGERWCLTLSLRLVFANFGKFTSWLQSTHTPLAHLHSLVNLQLPPHSSA